MSDLPARKIIRIAVSFKHGDQLMYCQSIRMGSTVLAEYSIELRSMDQTCARRPSKNLVIYMVVTYGWMEWHYAFAGLSEGTIAWSVHTSLQCHRIQNRSRAYPCGCSWYGWGAKGKATIPAFRNSFQFTWKHTVFYMWMKNKQCPI